MAKLYFRYGTMGSSKTANALMVRYNYEEKGKNAVMIKPETDTRDGKRKVKSRLGLEASCRPLSWFWDQVREVQAAFPVTEKGDEWLDIIREEFDCVICDEAQFFTEDEVDYLTYITDTLDIPVICYGLRTDFQGNFFPASAKLLALADEVEEIPTICWCGCKAKMNARVIDGRVVREGEQIVLGSNDLYVGLCRKHFKEGKLSEVG